MDTGRTLAQESAHMYPDFGTLGNSVALSLLCSVFLLCSVLLINPLVLHSGFPLVTNGPRTRFIHLDPGLGGVPTANILWSLEKMLTLSLP